MNLTKKLKNFFTMSRKANGGFTLVELIVVIAILAILGGVAVPAYSGYVKKANMTADQALASDVAYALTMYYYNNGGKVDGGYVVLKADGTVEMDENGIGAAAMEAAFGSDWRNVCKLKYDGWTGGLYNEVAKLTDAQIETITNSTFLTHATTESMMNAATGLLEIAATEIAGSDNISGNLTKLGLTALNDKLSGVDQEDMGTVIANLLVGTYAEAIANGTVNATAGDENFDPMVNLMNIYANAYAYTEYSGNDAYQRAVEQAIINAANDPNGGVDALKNLGSTSTNWGSVVGRDVYGEYRSFGNNFASGNNAALKEMMGAISVVANGYADNESLADPNLFSSATVTDQVNSFVNAVKLVDSGVTLPTLYMGDVALVLFADGTVLNSIG